MENIRARSTVLVVNNDKFVLIFRHKNGQDYYAIPGGGIEIGESPEMAAVREIDEELGINLKNKNQVSEVSTSARHDFNFIGETDDNDIVVTGSEKKHLNDPDDLFKPEWHSKDSFRRDIPIYPESAREMFSNFIKNL